MKKTNMHYFYPAYFDKNKTRKEGRRVNNKLAIEKPSIDKLVAAANRLNLKGKVEDKAYSRDPFARGRLGVTIMDKKSVVLKKLAKTLKKSSRK